jgi:hypothetical protein
MESSCSEDQRVLRESEGDREEEGWIDARATAGCNAQSDQPLGSRANKHGYQSFATAIDS